MTRGLCFHFFTLVVLKPADKVKHNLAQSNFFLLKKEAFFYGRSVLGVFGMGRGFYFILFFATVNRRYYWHFLWVWGRGGHWQLGMLSVCSTRSSAQERLVRSKCSTAICRGTSAHELFSAWFVWCKQLKKWFCLSRPYEQLGESVHDLLRLGHLCGFFLSGELDPGCGGHGLWRAEVRQHWRRQSRKRRGIQSNVKSSKKQQEEAQVGDQLFAIVLPARSWGKAPSDCHSSWSF